MDPYDKPDLDEMLHYGVKGMKWGQSKSGGGSSLGGDNASKKVPGRKRTLAKGAAAGIATVWAGKKAINFAARSVLGGGNAKVKDLNKEKYIGSEKHKKILKSTAMKTTVAVAAVGVTSQVGARAIRKMFTGQKMWS